MIKKYNQYIRENGESWIDPYGEEEWEDKSITSNGLPEIKKSPWTQEEVNELNNLQKSGKFHPYTCDREAKECEVNQIPRDFSKDGILIATKDGWICPCGKYRQNWHH